MINREKAKKTFADYVDKYDTKDPKILLKILHTYRVAELCETIAVETGLATDEVDFAWLCGLFHDIGRFEQVRRFGTFTDADSVDHAKFGAEILFEEPLEAVVRELLPKEEMRENFRIAVASHSAYRIDEGLTKEQKLFCDILRDADKIDIFRVNIDTPFEDIYNVTREELRQSDISPEVMQAFYEHHAVLRSVKKTPADYAVAHMALYFELVFPISRKLVREQGYLEQLMQFPTENESTKKKLEEIRRELCEIF